MVNRPKSIGTAAETAVVRYLREHGFPHAERRALAGSYDLGDVTGCPGLVVEVKGGAKAKNASDGLVHAWLMETETERVNAHADIGLLVLQRAGIGPTNAGRWWAVTSHSFFTDNPTPPTGYPVWLYLQHAVLLLRAAGYGEEPAVVEIPGGDAA